MYKNLYHVIDNFITSIEPDLLPCASNEFAYYRNTGEVVYTIYGENIDDFMMFLRTKCDFVDELDPFMWAVLHEIGHHFTIDNIVNDDEYDPLVTAFIQVVNCPETFNAYFYLPEEMAATQWAIDFVTCNPDMIQAALQSFNNALALD